MRLLARRPHASAELAAKLIRRGHAPDEVGATLAKAAQCGYLDDGAFARALVRRRCQGRGRAAIAAELVSRGVDRASAEAALEQLQEADQVEAAARLARRLVRGREVPPAGLLALVGPRLQRRGFSARVIRAACALTAAPDQIDPPGGPV